VSVSVSQDGILHLFNWDKKFFLSFRELIRERFANGLHHFIVYGSIETDALPTSSDTVIYTSLLQHVITLSVALHKANRIILHGLFSYHLFCIFVLQPWLLKKCYWVIWGGDLYVHKDEAKTWRGRTVELLRSICIKRVGHLVTYIRGDVDLARKWYGATGQHHECFTYPSNVYREIPEKAETHSTINIQIGNSADPSNSHLELLRRLMPYRDQDLTIYAPLSYGDKYYMQSVIKAGKTMFKDKFVPLTEFMPIEQYLDFLGRIDIAIFNHERQQAMGNIITLLGLGKKVFLRKDVTPWAFFVSLGVRVFNVEQIDISPIDENDLRRNKEIVSGLFSERKLIEQLEELFQ